MRKFLLLILIVFFCSFGFAADEETKATERAQAHDGGIVDLSVGTPVDPVPQLIQDALAAGANSPGYPATWGTAARNKSGR